MCGYGGSHCAHCGAPQTQAVPFEGGSQLSVERTMGGHHATAVVFLLFCLPRTGSSSPVLPRFFSTCNHAIETQPRANCGEMDGRSTNKNAICWGAVGVQLPAVSLDLYLFVRRTPLIPWPLGEGWVSGGFLAAAEKSIAKGKHPIA